MPRLSTFIRENTEEILSEWESFARSLPTAEEMDIAALRDHAKDMLGAIAKDLDQPQTKQEQAEKSKGESDTTDTEPDTPAEEHGAGRAESGFSVGQMVAEFRALRASVMRLWSRKVHDVGAVHLEDMTRFNEAIDQAIAESIMRYTQDIGDSKERFLAILGHDLRTPLGAIITSTQFMLDADAANSELRDPNLTLVRGVARAARRMSQMVADLLEFARTSFGDKIPIERADMDAGKMVVDVAAEVRASYPACALEVATSGNLMGRWDAERLTQAVTNLIGNAVQHGSAAVPIRIGVHGSDTEVTICVQNEGPVIPPEKVSHIFEGMNQAPTSESRDRRHLGLGLYIVDKIVTAHGGTIAVDSSAQKGTQFTIRLPREASA